MARNKWRRMPTGRRHAHASLIIQAFGIRRNFPSFRAAVSGDRLWCVGKAQPTIDGPVYRSRIDYRYGGVPQVRIVVPDIAPRPEIHMYQNGTLCLFDWREQPWLPSCLLHETILPWMAEWLLLYEAFLLTGRWLGPEAEHCGTKHPQIGRPRRPGQESRSVIHEASSDKSALHKLAVTGLL